jgi:ATP-dependent Clp protease ATP-binding subunit ClpA
MREEVRARVASLSPRGSEPVSTSVDLPCAPAVQHIFALAAEEATALERKSIDSTHLLLGIPAEKESRAAGILTEHGFTYDTYRRELSSSPASTKPARTASRLHLWGDDYDLTQAPAAIQSSLLRFERLVDGVVNCIDSYSESYGEQILKRSGRSRKQALGHLIDLTAAHQQWIARALDEATVATSGYPTEEWVAAQHYATFPWGPLVDLWVLLNHLLFHVIAHIPEAKLNTPCRIGLGEPAPLAQVIERYLGQCEEIAGELPTRSK